jgi:hypothetical protein
MEQTAVVWWPTILRGYATGVWYYTVMFALVRSQAHRFSRSFGRLSDGDKGEWTSCVVSTGNAMVLVLAVVRDVFNRSVRSGTCITSLLCCTRASLNTAMHVCLACSCDPTVFTGWQQAPISGGRSSWATSPWTFPSSCTTGKPLVTSGARSCTTACPWWRTASSWFSGGWRGTAAH